MVVSLARACALACLAVTPALAEQAAAPKLSKSQREALFAVVSAVDAAAAQPDSTETTWQTHVLRASDGSHYVAFSAGPPPAWLPATPVLLYVRLASRGAGPTLPSERSAVMEWLQGLRSDPLPLRPAQAIAVASGELPIGGTTAMSTRQGGVGQSSAALAWVARERERDRERQDAREKQRRALLESGAQPSLENTLFPFEDFDLGALAVSLPGGPPLLRRSFTAGPGDYDLYVGWVDPSDRPAAVHVLKHAVRLPTAPRAGLALSTIIVADAVGVRDTPYPADQQTAHPYAIGATDITPARDEIFTSAERLAVVFQVINPQAAATGKPDVSIAFRLFRATAAGDESVGTLNPQHYNADTLPADFDLAKGHPVFAAVAVPLARLQRGAYRLQITATDRLAGLAATGDAPFRLVGTPATLLASAPSLGAAFGREAILEPAVLDAVVAALRPPAPSVPLARLLDAVADRRFVDALRDETVNVEEQGVRAAIKGIALYALGDTPIAAASQLQQALQRSTPVGPTHVFLGACRALTGNDREAILSWKIAADAGVARGALRDLLVDGYLRQGDAPGALAAAGVDGDGSTDGWNRGRTAAMLLTGRDAEAGRLLDERLSDRPDDLDAQWLRLHALFSQFARGEGVGATAEGRERFARLARAYAEAAGTHGALATEWLEVMSRATPE